VRLGCRRVSDKDLVEDAVPGAALGVGACGLAHVGVGGGIGEDVGDGGGEVFIVRDAAGSCGARALIAAGWGG
jgi:hypothetical protein